MEASALPASVGLARARLGLGAPLLRLRSDEQLVSLFRVGNEDAFRVIHDRYRARMLGYARQMLAATAADPEDAVQEIFVRAYAGLRANRRDLALRAWLYRIAHNRCIDELRRPLPIAVEAVDAFGDGSASDPQARFEQREALRRLISDVQRLPEQQRSALLMRELGGMPYADLAGALGVSVPAVKSLLVRARVGLAQASEARDTACATIRADLIDAHDRGVRASGRARRHLRDCDHCAAFRTEVQGVSRSFGLLLPALGPVAVAAKLLGIGGLGLGLGSGTGAAAGSGTGAAAASGTVAGGTVVGGTTAATSAAAVAGGGAAASTGALASVGAAAGAGHVVTIIAATAIAAGGAISIQHEVAASGSSHHVRHHHVAAHSGAPAPQAAATVSPPNTTTERPMAAAAVTPAVTASSNPNPNPPRSSTTTTQAATSSRAPAAAADARNRSTPVRSLHSDALHAPDDGFPVAAPADGDPASGQTTATAPATTPTVSTTDPTATDPTPTVSTTDPTATDPTATDPTPTTPVTTDPTQTTVTSPTATSPVTTTAPTATSTVPGATTTPIAGSGTTTTPTPTTATKQNPGTATGIVPTVTSATTWGGTVKKLRNRPWRTTTQRAGAASSGTVR